MIRRPPKSTRTDTLLPYTTLFRSEIEVPPEQFGRGMMADRDEPALDIERRHVTRHRILKLERDQPLRAAAADEPVDFLVPQHVDPLVREQPFLKDAFAQDRKSTRLNSSH